MDWYIIYYNNTNNLYFYHNQYMKDILKTDTCTLIERIIDEYVVGMKYENKGGKDSVNTQYEWDYCSQGV